MTLRSPLLALSLVLPAAVFAQGALAPPGAPAPTMKSLDQIAEKQEARIAIETLPGDATHKHVISVSGSYYLRGNLTVASTTQTAIRVTSSGVTIDLNGFAITGPGPSSTVAAIGSIGARTTVRNGTIADFGSGVSLGTHGEVEGVAVANVAATGIAVSTISGIVRHCRVQNAGSTGILGTLVHDCTVSNVLGATGAKTGISATVVRNCSVYGVDTDGEFEVVGIRANVVESCRVANIASGGEATGISRDSTNSGSVRDCVVEDVSAGAHAYGITSESIAGCTVQTITSSGDNTTGIQGASVSNCSVSTVTNTSAAFGSIGIQGSTVRGCEVNGINSTNFEAYGIRGTQVSDNTVQSVGLVGSGGIGIYGLQFAVIRDNSVNNCRNFGIRLGGQSVAYHNTVANVGAITGITDGAHIYSSTGDNRIEANTLQGGASQDYGVRVIGSRNLIIGNRASFTFSGAATGAGGIDTPEFNIGAGCRFGPIATAAANGEITTTNPYANYAD